MKRPERLVMIGELPYTARLPLEVMPDSATLTGTPFPDAAAPRLLCHLASALTRAERAGHGPGSSVTWRAIGSLFDEDTTAELARRIGTTGDPLTPEGVHAGALEAVRLLAEATPRPAVLGVDGRTVWVTIAGEEYAATVPEVFAGLPMAAAMVGGPDTLGPDLGPLGELVEQVMPAGLPTSSGILGLLLFDEATLHVLNARILDPADACTTPVVLAALHHALEALALSGLCMGEGERQGDEAAIDDELAELDHERRMPSPPVVMTIAGCRNYHAAYPAEWPRFLELVAEMGPLLRPADGVARNVQIEALERLVRQAVPMVLAPSSVAEIGRHVAFDRSSVVDVGTALMAVMVDLDASHARAHRTARTVAMAALAAGGGA